MCIAGLALTSLDSVGRIGSRAFIQLFMSDEQNQSKIPAWQKFLTNKYVATAITLVLGYILCLGGYNNVWALFGAANQMLAALVLMGIAVFLKATGRKHKMLLVPMVIMFAVCLTAIVLNVVGNVQKYAAGKATFLVNGMQLIVAVFLIALSVIVAVTCVKKLIETKEGSANSKAA
jgi:carbon starvation protein